VTAAAGEGPARGRGWSWRGRSWRGRVPALVLGAAVVGGAALLAAGGLEGALTYYETPTEASASPASGGHPVRLGGLVVVGSVQRHGSTVSFTLTDGANDVHVVSGSALPATFRGGQGAVVQGHMAGDRGGEHVFRADSVVVRHSNEYQPPGAAQ